MAVDKTVRITVIGDEGVGKTSLIAAAATECFSDNPPPVLPPARLPAESTPENVPILITDTSSRPEDRPGLESAVTNAHVVVLAFDCNRPATLQKCANYWLRELMRLGVNVPVVLVGCKADLKSLDEELRGSVVQVVSQFKQVEICLECSARNLQYVGEVFYYALKSVVNPIGPLFDSETATLKPLCVRALKRVFYVCDKDKDKVLNDAELNAFQVRCFNAPLAPDELAAVKKVVSEKLPQGVTSTGGLTFHGFLFLHALFIEKGRTETPWAVLRTFGYDDLLKLSDEVLDALNFKRGPDQVVELTARGIDFLTSCFQCFDSDHDGVLSAADQEEMFSTAPSSPWTGRVYERLLVERGHGGGLTLKGFLALWVYTTAVDPRKSLAYCLYLGYEANPQELFLVARPRKQERRQDTCRGVLQTLVFGAPDSGKSSLVAGLANTALQPAMNGVAGPAGLHHREASLLAVGRVALEGSSSCWLIMREVDEEAAVALLGSDSRDQELAAADAAVFVFDCSDPDSFDITVRLLQEVAMASGDSLPCILLAAKDDLGMSPDLAKASEEACAQLGLPLPLSVSMRVGESGAFYASLCQLARQPSLAIPLTPTLKASRRQRQMLRRVLLYSALGSSTVGALYVVYRMYRSDSTSAGRQLSFTEWALSKCRRQR